MAERIGMYLPRRYRHCRVALNGAWQGLRAIYLPPNEHLPRYVLYYAYLPDGPQRP